MTLCMHLVTFPLLAGLCDAKMRPSQVNTRNFCARSMYNDSIDMIFCTLHLTNISSTCHCGN